MKSEKLLNAGPPAPALAAPSDTPIPAALPQPRFKTGVAWPERAQAASTQFIYWFTVLVSAETLFAVPLLTIERLKGSHVLAAVIGIASGALMLIGAVLLRAKMVERLAVAVNPMERVPAKVWVAGCVVAGLALRSGWVLLYPGPLRSDAYGYFDLARRLILTGRYYATTPSVAHIAFWPPGYPLFLTVPMCLFGISERTVLGASMALFCATAILVYLLARRVASPFGARLAVALYCVWPNLVAQSTKGAKESLLEFLLVLALLAYVAASRRSGWVRWSAIAAGTGAAAGFAALTQPGWLLLPAVFVVYEFASGRLGRSVPRLAVVALAMFAVILPWTIRNHRALGHWVLISTNGGDVFYRANNPWATGGFTPRGQQTFLNADEVRRSEIGYELGKAWIKEHPGPFLSLAVRKQMLLLGDDGNGVYESLRRSLGISGIQYAAFQTICNLFWLGFFVLLTAVLVHRRSQLLTGGPWLILPLPLLYLVTVHSVSQSDSRFHTPVIGVLAVLFAAVLWPRRVLPAIVARGIRGWGNSERVAPPTSLQNMVGGRRPAVAPKLREARLDDYPRIAQLASRYDMPSEPWERWKNLWLGNPAYESGRTIGWILETRSDTVGWFANVPLHYYFDSEVLQTASPRSWVVDEQYRGYAMLLGDAFLRQPGIDLALVTSGNDRGGQAFAAVGGQPVPQRISPEVRFWITGYSGFVAAYLRRKGVPGRALCAPAIATGLRFRDFLFGMHNGGSQTYRAERADRFDARFDAFWGELREQRRQILTGRRDAAALEWHFGPALRNGTAWLFTCSSPERLSAYAIFLRVDSAALKLRRVMLVDYQAEEGEGEHCLAALLSAALRQCVREQLHLLDIPPSRLAASAAVRKLAPHMRTATAPPACLYKPADRIEPLLRHASAWDLSPFDGDSSLSPVVIG